MALITTPLRNPTISIALKSSFASTLINDEHTQAEAYRRQRRCISQEMRNTRTIRLRVAFGIPPSQSLQIDPSMYVGCHAGISLQFELASTNLIDVLSLVAESPERREMNEEQSILNASHTDRSSKSGRGFCTYKPSKSGAHVFKIS